MSNQSDTPQNAKLSEEDLKVLVEYFTLLDEMDRMQNGNSSDSTS
jgi:hypothetical protein